MESLYYVQRWITWWQLIFWCGQMWKSQRLESLTVCCKNSPFFKEFNQSWAFADHPLVLLLAVQGVVSLCWFWQYLALVQCPWLLTSRLDISHCLTWVTPSCFLLRWDCTPLSDPYLFNPGNKASPNPLCSSSDLWSMDPTVSPAPNSLFQSLVHH